MSGCQRTQIIADYLVDNFYAFILSQVKGRNQEGSEAVRSRLPNWE